MNQSALGKIVAVVIAAVAVVGFATAFVAEAITQLVCGVRPEASGPLSGLMLAVTGNPATFALTGACALPVWQIRVADLVLVLLVAGLAGFILFKVRQYRQSDAAFVAELRMRPGFAQAGVIRENFSPKAVLKRAPQLRPTLKNPKPSDVGWRVGRSRGMDVYVSVEDSVALEGPPRSGKGYRILISAIIDWSGPLITTSTTNDNLTATMKMRQKRGNVHVFDPQGLSGIRNPLRINPLVGCDNPLVAMQRGQAIITGTALGTSTTNAEWAQAASIVLGQLLHAAAVGGRTMSDVHAWGSSPGKALDAIDFLRFDGAPGWAQSLEATLSGDDKLVSSIWFGVQSAVAPLAIPQIREALLPQPGDPIFDPQEFLNDANTLYLIGSASGAAAMGGFLGAIVDDIVEVARNRALSSPNARLSLPLGLILDEIANMFRWGNLPRVMADGGGRGICTFVVLQALSQAETAWSRAEADTIWAAATAKVLLGGASHVNHLRDVEALLGTRDTSRTQKSWSTRDSGLHTSEQYERRPLMSVDEIRRMPPTTGLLAYRNQRSVLLDLAGWDDRRDARAIKTGMRETETEQRGFFGSVERPPLPPRPATSDGTES